MSNCAICGDPLKAPNDTQTCDSCILPGTTTAKVKPVLPKLQSLSSIELSGVNKPAPPRYKRTSSESCVHASKLPTVAETNLCTPNLPKLPTITVTTASSDSTTRMDSSSEDLNGTGESQIAPKAKHTLEVPNEEDLKPRRNSRGKTDPKKDRFKCQDCCECGGAGCCYCCVLCVEFCCTTESGKRCVVM